MGAVAWGLCLPARADPLAEALGDEVADPHEVAAPLAVIDRPEHGLAGLERYTRNRYCHEDDKYNRPALKGSSGQP